MSKDDRYNVSQHEGHTPGPWWLCCEDDTLYARWIQADEKSICSDLNEATEVDAQLLAATPEILDALKKAYEIIDALEAFHARELKIVWGLHDSVCEALDKTMSAWYEEKQKTAPE
jgi:hypothetical protein